MLRQNNLARKQEIGKKAIDPKNHALDDQLLGKLDITEIDKFLSLKMKKVRNY